MQYIDNQLIEHVKYNVQIMIKEIHRVSKNYYLYLLWSVGVIQSYLESLKNKLLSQTML